MHIEAHFSLITSDDAELAHAQQALTSAMADIAGPNGNHSIEVNALSLEKLMTAIKFCPVFLDEDRISLINDLIDEFHLSSARITFYPTPEWGYGILTDQGIEYFGSLDLNAAQSGVSPDLIKRIPIHLQFLALIGLEPEDALLVRFRSHQFSWVGLRDDIDRETFFTQNNIAKLWDNPEEASQYFISDRSTALKLAGHLD